MPIDWSALLGAGQNGGQGTPLARLLGMMPQGGDPPAAMTGTQGVGPIGGQITPSPPTPGTMGGAPAQGGGGMLSGLFGGGGGGGIMGPLAAAAGMMQAAGPSRMPTNLGQTLGAGLGGFLQGHMADRQIGNEDKQQQALGAIAQRLGFGGATGAGGSAGTPPTMLPGALAAMGGPPATAGAMPPAMPPAVPGAPPVPAPSGMPNVPGAMPAGGMAGGMAQPQRNPFMRMMAQRRSMMGGRMS